MRGKLTTTAQGHQTQPRFNEARANCAGNSAHDCGHTTPRPSFNEARANCAGNLLQHVLPVPRERASMRPAQIAREILKDLASAWNLPHASMRPAQIAREINRHQHHQPQRHPASMRPAQIAREIAFGSERGRFPLSGFNEARANCAGNSRGC